MHTPLFHQAGLGCFRLCQPALFTSPPGPDACLGALYGTLATAVLRLCLCFSPRETKLLEVSLRFYLVYFWIPRAQHRKHPGRGHLWSRWSPVTASPHCTLMNEHMNDDVFTFHPETPEKNWRSLTRGSGTQGVNSFYPQILEPRLVKALKRRRHPEGSVSSCSHQGNTAPAGLSRWLPECPVPPQQKLRSSGEQQEMSLPLGGRGSRTLA